MKILSFSCRDFRNLQNIEISSFDEMNVICGENAQGKTNLLEGIWLFTGIKSFRGAKDSAFVRFGCEKAELNIEFLADGIENDAKMEIKEHRTATFNNNKLKTPSLMAGKFNATVFSPNDLGLVRDGPAVRRRFLDIAIGQLYPSYISAVKNYMRAVTQRNQIIKDYRYDGTVSVMLDIFEDEIAANGNKINEIRKKYIERLGEFLPIVYDGLSSGKEKLQTEYISSCREENLRQALITARKNDMFTGTTSVGPHRDDIEFKINGVSARSFGSQGQKRSVALALKLAEAEVINKVSGEYPVFLLDDVMSELDPERQNYILNHIKGIQSFITCCDPSNVERLKSGKIFEMKNGRIV
ncbi:MAG: DNA replication/repair protein RecF [Acutalibacteraceae bacterium]|nr:DNA replication/repair protein RecF [Acutalibacteraceae bacterium]